MAGLSLICMLLAAMLSVALAQTCACGAHGVCSGAGSGPCNCNQGYYGATSGANSICTACLLHDCMLVVVGADVSIIRQRGHVFDRVECGRLGRVPDLLCWDILRCRRTKLHQLCVGQVFYLARGYLCGCVHFLQRRHLCWIWFLHLSTMCCWLLGFSSWPGAAKSVHQLCFWFVLYRCWRNCVKRVRALPGWSVVREFGSFFVPELCCWNLVVDAGHQQQQPLPGLPLWNVLDIDWCNIIRHLRSLRRRLCI